MTRLDFEKFGTHEIRLKEILSESEFTSSGISSRPSPIQPNETQTYTFNIKERLWKAKIERALSGFKRPWNQARLALEEPVFVKRNETISGKQIKGGQNERQAPESQ